MTPVPTPPQLDALKPTELHLVEAHANNSHTPWPLHPRLQRIERVAVQAGQARVGVLAMPINPADLLQFQGDYGLQPSLPFTPGHESVGVVLELGPEVSGLSVGDWVLPQGLGHWRDEWVLPARQLRKIPPAQRVGQAAMLQANPVTAWAMLHHGGRPEAGDWIVLNAANSAVGQCLRQLAAQWGLRTVNVVRRRDAIPEHGEPEHPWLLDDGVQDLAAAIEQVTQGRRPRLGLDAVGGVAAQRMAAGLADGGCLLNYGLLSGSAVQVAAHDLIFRDVRVQGFWLANWYRDPAHRSMASDMLAELVAMQNKGHLHMDIEAHYPLHEIEQALAHAQRSHRGGKIVLTGAWLQALQLRL